MSLYHESIGLPAGFKAPSHTVALAYTKHASDVMTERGIRQLKMATLARFKPIEVEVINGRVKKIVFRGNYNETHDIVLVLIPEKRNEYVVKTVWLNEKNDNHSSLNISRYERP